MENGSRSFGSSDRGSFRSPTGRSRDDSFSGRGRGGPPSRSGFRGGYRGGPRGSASGGGRFDSGRYRDAPSYPTRDFESSRPPPRDYRATLTPPMDKDRRYNGGGTERPVYDREPGYRQQPDRSEFRAPARDPVGQRDYASPRNFPPSREYPSARPFDRPDPRDYADNRDYPRSASRGMPQSAGRRYPGEMRDVGRSDGFRGGRGGRYDQSPPRAVRREYDPLPSRGYGSPADDYSGPRRSSDGGRYMAMRSGSPPADGYAPRGGPPPFRGDDRSRDMRPMNRRPASPPPYGMDGGPAAKRMRGGPSPSVMRGTRPRSPRGGPPPRRHY